MNQTGQPGFQNDIRPLFREMDRDAMEGAFDLWEHEDVSANADAIMTVLDGGSMPCDGPWPEEQIELFRRWVEAGKPA